MDNQTMNGSVPRTPGLSVCRGRLVYFVRHGRTKWNDTFRYQGKSDVPLDARGEEQARLTGLRLKKSGVTRIAVSPLLRALRTAEIIAGEIGAGAPEAWPDLVEEDFGKWEGLTAKGIIDSFGIDKFTEWSSDQFRSQVPGGESATDLYARCARVAEMITAARDAKMIIVGHGAMFRMLFMALLHLPPYSVLWRFSLGNCSISCADVDTDGRAVMMYLNDTLHLTALSDPVSLPLR